MAVCVLNRQEDGSDSPTIPWTLTVGRNPPWPCETDIGMGKMAVLAAYSCWPCGISVMPAGGEWERERGERWEGERRKEREGEGRGGEGEGGEMEGREKEGEGGRGERGRGRGGRDGREREGKRGRERGDGEGGEMGGRGERGRVGRGGKLERENGTTLQHVHTSRVVCFAWRLHCCLHTTN